MQCANPLTDTIYEYKTVLTKILKNSFVKKLISTQSTTCVLKLHIQKIF